MFCFLRKTKFKFFYKKMSGSFWVHYFFAYLTKLLRAHCNAHFVNLEPIKVNVYMDHHHRKGEGLQRRSTTSSQWDFRFLYPILVLIGGSIYGNIIFVYFHIRQTTETTEYSSITIQSVLSSPKTLYHQVFPLEMWPQSDIAFLLGVSFSAAIYASFLHHPCLVERYSVLTRKNKSSVRKVLTISGTSRSLYDNILKHL